MWWVLGQPVADLVGSASFDGEVTTEISPLASPILDLDGVDAVYLGPTFITVTKTEEAEWTDLAAAIVAAIKAWAASGKSADEIQDGQKQRGNCLRKHRRNAV